MPSGRVVKVSDRVYAALLELRGSRTRLKGKSMSDLIDSLLGN